MLSNLPQWTRSIQRQIFAGVFFFSTLAHSEPRPTLVWVGVDFPRWKLSFVNGDLPVRGIWFAKEAAPSLNAALACIKAHELAHDVQLLFTFEGSHVHRKIAGTNRWSNHAHGTALDINMYRAKREGQDPALVACFESNGFAWGGRWKSPYDPMHFEWRSP